MSRLRAGADVGEVLVELVRTTWLMRAKGRRAVGQAIRGTPHDESYRSTTIAGRVDVGRVMRAIRRAKRVWPVEVQCLQTAFVVRRVLERRGIPSTLRLGVRDDAGDLRFHAWVEAGGHVFDDQLIEKPFETFPGLDEPGTGRQRGVQPVLEHEP